MEELQFMFIYIVILWVVNVLFTIVEEIIEVSRVFIGSKNAVSSLKSVFPLNSVFPLKSVSSLKSVSPFKSVSPLKSVSSFMKNKVAPW